MDECLWAHMRIRVREEQPTCKKSSKERNDGCEPTIFFRNANSFLIRISPLHRRHGICSRIAYALILNGQFNTD